MVLCRGWFLRTCHFDHMTALFATPHTCTHTHNPATLSLTRKAVEGSLEVDPSAPPQAAQGQQQQQHTGRRWRKELTQLDTCMLKIWRQLKQHTHVL